MPIPTHLKESDYKKYFPDTEDEFPSVTNEEHYIDAWLINTAFNSILEVEEYLLQYKANIEAPIGDDVIGEDGNPLIQIPPARYPAYKSALAWDSNLLEENIKKDEIIFGITGTFEAVGVPLSEVGVFPPSNPLPDIITSEISHEIT